MDAKEATSGAAPGAAPSAATPASSSAPDGTAFKPVDSGSQVQSGEYLLIEAYALFWLLAMAFMVFAYLRTKRLESKVESLEAALERARAAGRSTKKAESKTETERAADLSLAEDRGDKE
ncbi:MAG: hypothetical protein U0271_00455 [Polyangiaceae bacterium]